jgi:hypothetical protein
MAHWAEILDKDCKRYKQNISSRDEVQKVYWKTNGVKNWKDMVLDKMGKEKQGKKKFVRLWTHITHGCQ